MLGWKLLVSRGDFHSKSSHDTTCSLLFKNSLNTFLMQYKHKCDVLSRLFGVIVNTINFYKLKNPHIIKFADGFHFCSSLWFGKSGLTTFVFFEDLTVFQ